MLHSADDPLSTLPIHRHLGRLAWLRLSVVLSEQMRDPIQRRQDQGEVRICSGDQWEQSWPLCQQNEGEIRETTTPEPAGSPAFGDKWVFFGVFFKYFLYILNYIFIYIYIYLYLYLQGRCRFTRVNHE